MEAHERQTIGSAQKSPHRAVLTSTWRGRDTDRMDYRTITDGLQELAAMIGAQRLGRQGALTAVSVLRIGGPFVLIVRG
jgi:hypothetical protein